jgi:hypothetical protein
MEQLDQAVAEAASRVAEGEPENYIVVGGHRFDFAEAVGAKFEMHAKYDEMAISVAFRVPSGVDAFERASAVAKAISDSGA